MLTRPLLPGRLQQLERFVHQHMDRAHAFDTEQPVQPVLRRFPMALRLGTLVAARVGDVHQAAAAVFPESTDELHSNLNPAKVEGWPEEFGLGESCAEDSDCDDARTRIRASGGTCK